MFGIFRRREIIAGGGQPRNVEEEALQWLALAYRNTDTDARKYTRWNMAVAYATGKAKGLSEPNPARPQE